MLGAAITGGGLYGDESFSQVPIRIRALGFRHLYSLQTDKQAVLHYVLQPGLVEDVSMSPQTDLFGKVFYGGYSCVHCAWWATTLELYAKCRWCSNDGWWVTLDE